MFENGHSAAKLEHRQESNAKHLNRKYWHAQERRRHSYFGVTELEVKKNTFPKVSESQLYLSGNPLFQVVIWFPFFKSGNRLKILLRNSLEILKRILVLLSASFD